MSIEKTICPKCKQNAYIVSFWSTACFKCDNCNPNICQKCKSNEIIPIIYGIIDVKDTLGEYIRTLCENGQIFYGGLKVPKTRPLNYCKNCKNQW